MPLPYYRRLNATQKAIYRASDAVADVPLGDPRRFVPAVAGLRAALQRGKPAEVQAAAGRLCRDLTTALGTEPLEVKVLSRRPSDATGELHGLYVRETGKTAVIRIWYRTAQQRRVVAFRTFVRTLMHEVCHHLDLTRLGLRETFHTEGFFRRESSLVRQLVPAERKRREVASAEESKPASSPPPRASRSRPAKAPPPAPERPGPPDRPARPEQLSLFGDDPPAPT